MNKQKRNHDFVENAIALFADLVYNHPQISAPGTGSDKETSEMKKFTKYLALALAVVLCLGALAGCTGGDDRGAAPTGPFCWPLPWS